MIRTIAAALAAFVFVAFSANAAEEKPPTSTSTDAARTETAKDAKASKKAMKKAKKKAKKAATPDTATPQPQK